MELRVVCKILLNIEIIRKRIGQDIRLGKGNASSETQRTSTCIKVTELWSGKKKIR